MKWKLTTRVTLVLLPATLAACQLVDLGQEATTSPAADPRTVACARWLQIAEGERVMLADRLVGASADLERIRVRQHQPPDTARDTLIRDVVGSLTKNCEVWPPRERSLGELMDAVY